MSSKGLCFPSAISVHTDKDKKIFQHFSQGCVEKEPNFPTDSVGSAGRQSSSRISIFHKPQTIAGDINMTSERLL